MHWIARWGVRGVRKRCSGQISCQLLPFLMPGSPASRPLLVCVAAVAWLALAGQKRGVGGWTVMGAFSTVARRRGTSRRR